MYQFKVIREITVDDLTKFLGGIRNIVSAKIYNEKTIDGYNLDDYYKKITEETGIIIVGYKESGESNEI